MITRILLVLSAALAAVVALSTRYVNEDLFGGLAAGRDIAAGLLLAPDHWSFTAEGLVWVNQAWLSHLTFYLSYEILAAAGPVLIKVTLFLACLGMVLFRSLSLGATLEISLAALLAGTLATAPFLGLRQENFGLFFFMAFSTLLTCTELPKRARQFGLLLVIVMWSNAHGSFMLGLGLLGLKAALESIRAIVRQHEKTASTPGKQTLSWGAAAEWWGLCGAALLLTAYVNPFGTKNLLMPFQQLGTAAVTKHSADWLPLFDFQRGDEGLFAGGNTSPYLIFVSVVVVLLVAVLVGRGASNSRKHASAGPIKSDWVMEALIALLTVVMAFRFGRLALFSGLSLIPVAAWLGQSLARQLGAGRHGHQDRLGYALAPNPNAVEIRRPLPNPPRGRGGSELSPVYWGTEGGQSHPNSTALSPNPSDQGKGTQVIGSTGLQTPVGTGKGDNSFRAQSGLDCLDGCGAGQSVHGSMPAWQKGVLPIAAGVLLVFMMALCYRVAVIPYLPENPLRPDRPVMRELMSFDSFSRPLTRFMRDNQLLDRVLAGWGLSPYLMWELPDVRLFMDTRDQSYYPAQVVQDYLTIMGVMAAPLDRVIALLDDYQVNTIALTTGPIDFDLALRLVGTRRWACLYTDPYSTLLVRADSPRFGAMIGTGDLRSLRFPDAPARTLSEASLDHFMNGTIRKDLAEALLSSVLRSPWPNDYSLMCWGLDDPRRCFRPDTVDLLKREAERLSTIDPRFANGAEQVTQSLIRIYEILAGNAMRCGDPGRSNQWLALRDRYQREYDAMRRYYLGALF